MLRLSWRQFRVQTVLAAGMLVAVGVALVVTGPNLVHIYDTVVAPCPPQSSACTNVTISFLNRYRVLQQIRYLVLIIPALIGMFWGAPLVARELEGGTFRLIWTQSVTRTRWLVVKLALGGLVSMAVAGLLSLMVTWWYSPLEAVARARMTPVTFGVQGIAPLGYAVFAFALGVTLGVVIRRTLPAMAATLAAFIGVRAAFTFWVRPYLLPPLHTSFPFQAFLRNPSSGGRSLGDWVLSDQTVNAAGKVIGTNGGIGPYGLGLSFGATTHSISIQGLGTCRGGVPPRAAASGTVTSTVYTALQRCLDHFHIREVVTYQPISRYWPLQGIETAIFLVLAVALAGFTLWWVRRRLV